MTVSLPEPVPLDLPPGDPGAVDELVRDVAGAALHLAGTDDRLRGPAARAPGWLGNDAVAAAGQVQRVAGVAARSAAAVLTAAGRLSSHAELLRDTRRQVGVLREQQEEDFRAAQLRLGGLADPRLAVMTGGTGWAGVVAEVEAAESVRRRRHAVLLEELADDVAATVGVLADATGPVGGTGRSDDGDRVLAHLALELPGWGDPYLGRRGVLLARALLDDDDASGWDDAAGEVLVHAGAAPFARALLLGLGVDGLRRVLLLLGDGEFGDDMRGPPSSVARLLSESIGAASTTRVEALLAGPLVSPVDEGTDADLVALGMGAVLAVRAGSHGPGASTVAAWGRQIVAREHAMSGKRAGTTAVERVFPRVDPHLSERFDPLPRVLESLAGHADPGAAAAFLGSRDAWEVLLGRPWDDGAEALSRVAAHVAGERGAAGQAAVRSALEVVGAGLVEEKPSAWTVDRTTVEGVLPGLGRAVAAQVEVAALALASVAAEGGGEDVGHLLEGLGYLTVDRGAAAAVGAALIGWVAEQPHDLTGSSVAAPSPLFAVPGSYVAVQEYGQRLDHALDGFELQQAADTRALVWNLTGGLALEVASFSRIPLVVLLAEGVKMVAPALLDADGTFTQGPDAGLRHDAHDAGADVVAALPPDLIARAEEARAQTEAAYRRTAAALGTPTPPISPDQWQQAFDSVVGPAPQVHEVVEDGRPRASPAAPRGR